MIRICATAMAALLSFAAVADTGRLELASGKGRVLLVELFTSEGCSSCPAADRWMSGLKDDARLWERIVPVAFHVDYWDYIGWPDRFASASYSARQRDHRRYGHVASVYTPGIVVGGNEWRGWFRSTALNLTDPIDVGRLGVVVENAHLDAEFAPELVVPEALELHVAVLGFDLATDVGAGENSGRRLEHDFVVLAHTVAPMARAGAQTFTASSDLPNPRIEAPLTGIAVWVSPAGDTTPIQAVGGWLGR